MVLKMLAITALMFAPYVSSGESLKGDWRGDSTCQQKNTACRDEKVIYHVSAADAAGRVIINADKIVNGKPVDMGTLILTYDKATQTLSGEDGPRVWHLDIKGNTMSGTLTNSGALVRKVELKKD